MSFDSVHILVSQDYALTCGQVVLLYCAILSRIRGTYGARMVHEFGAYERVRDADHERPYRIGHRTRPYSTIVCEYVCEVLNLICN